jgi:hypothetical protein
MNVFFFIFKVFEPGVDVMITVFGNFRQKTGVFSKTNVMIKIFA